MGFLTLFLFLLPLLAFAVDNDTGTTIPSKPDLLPTIEPPFDFNNIIEKGLSDNLEPTKYHINFLTDNRIPTECMNYAKERNHGPDEFEIFEIYYEDCHAPWVMCRLKEAKVNATTIAEVFGKMPLGMREFIRHMIVFKPKDLPGAAAWNCGDVMAISDDSFRLYVIAHEISHSLDSHVAIPNVTPPGKGGLSTSKRWAEQYGLDNATVSDYARTMWPENLAETGIIALYNIVVPNGVANLKNDPHRVFHQFATYTTYYRDIMTPRNKPSCTHRLPDSKMVFWHNISAEGIPTDTQTRKVGITMMPPGAFHNVTFVQPSGN
ncbi:hypothetical protein F4781DRAFT_438438 [Annulohypoxylon bovei var. microspora]|nr:hypothetical protein F4781DRAFT_438438 [Annulohypoxylon bovei var. microspora]